MISENRTVSDPKATAALLSGKGLRPTPQRIAVYDYLAAHPIHPTAETVFHAVSAVYPTFSKTTVYNSLHALADAGLIRTLTIEAQEQRFDGNPADHGHFRCDRCGEVFDFPLPADALLSLSPAEFALSGGDVFLRGACPACRKRCGD